MPHAVPLRHRRPNRRLLVRKPAVTHVMIPGLAPGRPARLSFDAALRQLRKMPPGEWNVVPTSPVVGTSFGASATVDADGGVTLDWWIPGPVPVGAE